MTTQPHQPTGLPFLMNEQPNRCTTARDALIMGAAIVALLGSVSAMRQDVFAMLTLPAIT